MATFETIGAGYLKSNASEGQKQFSFSAKIGCIGRRHTGARLQEKRTGDHAY